MRKHRTGASHINKPLTYMYAYVTLLFNLVQPVVERRPAQKFLLADTLGVATYHSEH